MKKSVFICEGFIDEQLLWIIPIVCAYAKKKRIKKILFQKKIDLNIFPKSTINLLNKFEISYQKEKSTFEKKCLFFFYFLKNLKIFIYVLLNLKKNKLLSSKVSWTKLQYLHGTWDEINLKKNKHTFNFVLKVKTIIFGIYQLELGKKLIKKGIDNFFLSHTVYNKRWFLAYIRQFNVKIYLQNFMVLYEQSKKNDAQWADIVPKTLRIINKDFKKINLYWLKRNQGKSNYSANNYSILKNFKPKDFNLEKNYNLILLHIFRDSPFAKIDRERIFVDYYDWFKNTLQILKNTNEKVLIKMHPIYKRWGENQPLIVKKIFDEVFKNGKSPKNFQIIKEYPKKYLFKNAKRIITFSGTAAIEAVAYSKKPIVICKATIENFCKGAVYRPKNYEEYMDLLMSDRSFLNESRNSSIAKKIIYARENIVSMRKILKNDDIYRNDKKSLRKNNLKIVLKNSIKCSKILYNQGIKLANGAPYTSLNN